MRATPWIFPLGVLLGGLLAAFPVAILLYWLTNNLWTLVQQRIVFRRLAAEEARPAGPGRVPEPVVPESVAAGPAVPAPALRPGAKPARPRRRPTSAASRTGGKAAAGRRRRAPGGADRPYPIRTRARPGPNLRGPRSVLSGTTPDTDEEETVHMATTARRIGRIAAASAVSRACCSPAPARRSRTIPARPPPRGRSP